MTERRRGERRERDASPRRSSSPVETRGLTHIALAVANLERSVAFYQSVLGSVEVFRGPKFVQLQTPGAWDVLVLEERPSSAGRVGGVIHFGFRLKRANSLPRVLARVEAAGGTVIETGEFVPGEPYLFAKDPDGYVVEIWYELPTKVDPRQRRRSRPTR